MEADMEAETKSQPMSERDMQNVLDEAIGCWCDESRGLEEEVSVRTYEDAGMLTMNKGLVVTIGGNEFQVTIVQTKQAR
jgi:hypothetical protein